MKIPHLDEWLLTGNTDVDLSKAKCSVKLDGRFAIVAGRVCGKPFAGTKHMWKKTKINMHTCDLNMLHRGIFEYMYHDFWRLELHRHLHDTLIDVLENVVKPTTDNWIGIGDYIGHGSAGDLVTPNYIPYVKHDDSLVGFHVSNNPFGVKPPKSFQIESVGLTRSCITVINTLIKDTAKYNETNPYLNKVLQATFENTLNEVIKKIVLKIIDTYVKKETIIKHINLLHEAIDQVDKNGLLYGYTWALTTFNMYDSQYSKNIPVKPHGDHLHEGYVVSIDGQPIFKIVDRAAFSARNHAMHAERTD